MCGISGIISSVAAPLALHQVKKMNTAMAHRGPDGQATWANDTGQVFFGHCRLSIIDLSAAASQPLQYKNRYSIVHNGEIYNYKELASTLKSKGYQFSTSSDTEVILAAYDCYKSKCLELFDGMFAFAIWDNAEKTFFAARDRFGEKPFYYHFDKSSGQLCFASELKALWNAGIAREPDEHLFLLYLSLGIASDPQDNSRTFFKNIKQLKPAHYLTWQPSITAGPEIKSYWQLDKTEETVLNEKEVVERFTSLLTQSITHRLRADVSIGTSLSGGLDSSSLVALISQSLRNNSQYTQQAFTAGFKHFEKDESALAALVAKKFELQHHIVEPVAEQFADDLESFIQLHEEPIDSASAYAQFKVFELAKQNGIKVLLDGQGADESMAGYSKYIHWYLQQLIASGNIQEFHREKKYLESNRISFDWSFKNWLAAISPSLASSTLRKRSLRTLANNADLNDAYLNEYFHTDDFRKPVIRKLNDILHYNMTVSGLNELLRYADKNSMAHGREVRLPYLHHELVQFIFQLPSSIKIRNGYGKWILRQSMNELLPQQITWRKDKVGFEPPQAKWMENGKVQEQIRNAKWVLVKKGILNPAVLDKKIQPHSAYAADRNDWRYLVTGVLLNE